MRWTHYRTELQATQAESCGFAKKVARLDWRVYTSRMKREQFFRSISAAIRASSLHPEEIAEIAGISEASVRSVRDDKRMPSVVNADGILRALGKRLVIGDPAGDTLDL